MASNVILSTVNKKQDLSESYNKFAFELFKQIENNAKNENIFVSPYSISTALALCYTGARNNTEKQLAKLLNYTNLSNDQIHNANSSLIDYLHGLKGDVELNVANRIYPKTGFTLNKDYTSLLTQYYKSDIQALDFSNKTQSVKIINEWVEAQTKNKIKNLLTLDAINDATKLILVNAIYFKGSWAKQFQKESTYPDEFQLSNGSKAKVDMMVLNGNQFKYSVNPVPNLDAAVCELPYIGGKLSMTVILPNQDVDISSIESKLDSNILKEIFAANQCLVKVNVLLPKFKLEQSFELSNVISKMGAQDAFSNKSDFSGITNQVPLSISKVIHKAVVEVSEEGTEAAAATAVTMVKRCAPIQRVFVFKCDRPFLFFIHDNQSQIILFMGKYEKP